MANQIKDFGEHIGGAKKELYQRVNEMTDGELSKYSSKAKIWAAPKYEKMMEKDGYSREALYYISKVRDALPAKPASIYNEQEIKDFIYMISLAKETALQLKTREDLANFKGNEVIKPMSLEDIDKGIQNEWFMFSPEETVQNTYEIKEVKVTNIDEINHTYGFTNLRKHEIEFFPASCPDSMKDKPLQMNETVFLVTNRDDLFSSSDVGTFSFNDDSVTIKSSYCIAVPFRSYEDAKAYKEARVEQHMKEIQEKAKENKEEQKTEKEKEQSTRKKKYKETPLDAVIRKAPDADAKNKTGNDILKDFGIRGGEFGNWLSDNERQENLDKSYDAFKDLATALDIIPDSIGLKGKLAVAYGSRGMGDYAAHYEPYKKVINLTKMRGAGSLAHEFFHAMDNIFYEDNLKGSAVVSEPFATEQQKYKQDSIFGHLCFVMKNTEITDKDEMANREKEAVKTIEDAFVKKLGTCGCPYGSDSLDDKQKAACNEFFEFCVKSAHEAAEGKLTREFDFKKSRYIYPPELGNALNDFAQRLGSKGNITRNLEWIQANIFVNGDRIKSAHQKYFGEKAYAPSEYLKNACAMGVRYTKTGLSYWDSDIEMAARAFACYVKDKLEEKGIRNDYLCGHAEGELTAPHGKEREAINKEFDKVIDLFKEKGLFKSAPELHKSIADEVLENDVVYVPDTSHKEKQLEVIQKYNPMLDDIHTGIRSVDDIKTFKEAMKDDESFVYGDFSYEDAEKALKSGKITVYSSHPIEQGVFISTSYNMAKDYCGEREPYSKTVDIDKVAWINGDEGQFADVDAYSRDDKEIEEER